jgi:hypothetical protein
VPRVIMLKQHDGPKLGSRGSWGASCGELSRLWIVCWRPSEKLDIRLAFSPQVRIPIVRNTIA